MSFITQSLARQSAILNQSNAEMQAIRASQNLQDLAANGGKDIRAVAEREKQLLLQKEQAELKAKVARAQKDSLKTKKNKLDIFA